MTRPNFSFYDVWDAPVLKLVDVGAARTSKAPFYQNLLDKGRATVIGFEPDPEAFTQLKAREGASERYIQAFVGDGEPATFHHTAFRFAGSLYAPNPEFAERFKGLTPFLQSTHTSRVDTRRLDDLITDAEIDFLKLDVQGGELNVLRGAPRLLSSTLVAEIETEFVPIYSNQPLFAEVDQHMRASGFQFHTFSDMTKFFYTPVRDSANALGGHSQVVYANSIYIPSLPVADRLPRERLLKLVAILHDFYNSWDLCLHLLQKLAARGDAEPLHAYARTLQPD